MQTLEFMSYYRTCAATLYQAYVCNTIERENPRNKSSRFCGIGNSAYSYV